MSDKRATNEELTPFEAQLAALRPRADRLDANWRSLLAKEAALTAETLLPSPIGRGAGGEGSAGSDERQEALTLTLSQKVRGQVAGCINPTGHRFVCVHCGNEATSPSVLRRRTLHTALAVMTGVAATVLVMLVTHWGATAGLSGSAGNVSGATAGSPSSANHRRTDSLATSATHNVERSGFDPGDDPMSCVCMRAEVLRHGVEWLDRRPSRAATPVASPDRPLSNRDFLDRLLKEQRGS